MSLALENYQWAEALIRSLSQMGCIHFFIAPGSRNAPISMACIRHVRGNPALHCHTHFDERSLAFAALGAAKATLIPSVVITSSGSAVANLLPAAVEAEQTQTPLILLTADRPPELVGCGANQAIEQPGLFSHFCKLLVNLPLPVATERETRLADVYQQVQQTLYNTPGPIHLNVPLREPLYSLLDPLPELPIPASLPEQELRSTLTPNTLSAPVLIVAGQLNTEQAEAVLKTAENLQAPVFADIGSQLHQRQHPLVCTLHHYLCSEHGELLNNVATVLQFGGHLTSKPLMQWLQNFTGDYLLIHHAEIPLDPTGNANQQVIPIVQWPDAFTCQKHSLGLVQQFDLPQQRLMQVLTDNLASEFSEFSCCALLSQLIPDQQTLFLGNSLTIRLFDQLASTTKAPPTVFTNRGASGIDGLIASAAGVALARQQPITIVLGDLAALYDLNSLYWLSRSPTPITLVVLNNDGGQIFSMLPAAEQKDVYNDAFQHAHGLGFAEFARGFKLHYQAVTSLDELSQSYQTAQTLATSNLIEIRLPQDAFIQHQRRLRLALNELSHD